MRRLREGIEAPGVYARRNQILPGTFRGGPRKHGCLDFQKSLLVQVSAGGQHDPVARRQDLLQPSATQIQEAVAQPKLLARRILFLEGEGKRLAFVEDLGFLHPDLHLAGGQRRIDVVGRATDRGSFDLRGG